MLGVTVDNKSGEIRRYFNCTGRSHKKTCTGPKVTIYAEDLENMVYECISAKLADLKEMNRTTRKGDTAEVNELKLKIKAIEKSEKQLLDTMLAGGFNDDLLALVEIPPYLAAFVDLPFDGCHGMAALLTDHLPGQPTGRVADAIPDLPVLLQLPLASEPDVRINNTGVG